MLFGQRRKYLINREFQLQFIALLVFAAMLASIQLVSAVMILDSNVEQEAAKYGLTADPVVLSFIIVKHKEMLIQVFAFVGITIFLLAAFGLYFSHRIAGPIYKINKFLTELVKNGDLSQDLRLRRTDQFQEVAATINMVLEKIRCDRQNQLKILEEIQTKLGKNEDAKLLAQLEQLKSSWNYTPADTDANTSH